MKIWIGAEMNADVADAYRIARNSVEKAINDVVQKKAYSLPVDTWSCIGIVRDDTVFEERMRLQKKQRKMDFRLRIPYTEFRKSSSAERERMIFEMLMRSVSILRSKTDDSAAFAAFGDDLHSVAIAKGWIQAS